MNCFVAEKPWDREFYTSNGKFYYHAVPGNPCPYQPSAPFSAKYDGANCLIENVPADNNTFVWSGNHALYFKPAFDPKTVHDPKTLCFHGGSWDGSNCFVMGKPPTGEFHAWQGRWYYPPDESTKTCPYQPAPFAASYDGANCWVPLPAGAKGFTYNGALYLEACRNCTPPVIPASVPAPAPATGELDVNFDRFGMDYKNFDIGSVNACQAECQKDPNCKAFSFSNPGVFNPGGHCWLKNNVPPKTPRTGFVSGAKPVLPQATPGAPALPGVAPPKITPGELEVNFDRLGMDYKNFDIESASACQAECQKDPKCKAFSFSIPGVVYPGGHCWLKFIVPPKAARTGFVSGAKPVPPVKSEADRPK